MIIAGFLGSLGAGLATGVGGLPLLLMRQPSEEQQNALLGFAAGVMLAASFFSLILPALEAAEQRGASRSLASAQVVGAVLIGAFAIATLTKWLPSLAESAPGAAAQSTRRMWLFVTAIVLHNLPEGMAVGVSFGGGDFTAGQMTALAIGLQNIPEGLAVAIALISIGYGRGKAVLGGLASGLVEPVAGLIGASIVVLAQAALPWGLGLAAGAMIYVVASDVIPDAHRRVVGGGHVSTGLMIGLAAMIYLDTGFG